MHLIPSALPSHSGTYSCVAQNVLGQVKVETKTKTKAEKAKKTKTSTKTNTMAVKKAWKKTKTTTNSVTYSFVAQNAHGWVKAETKTKNQYIDNHK